MRIVSIAQNVPGPVAVARLVAEGATAVKIEPPSGDQLERFCKSWYDELHAGVAIERINLKTTQRFALTALLEGADVFLASQRPSSLVRLGVDADTLHRTYPQLRHVNIVGNTASPEEPGHDLTYQAQAGLIGTSMPLTLIGDMIGADRAYAAIKDAMHEPGSTRVIGLFDALHDLAAPLRHGLTAPGGWLNGGNPAYAIYPAKTGAVAVAALEPHFRARLYEGLGLDDGADPRTKFLSKTAEEWEQWAKQRDLPLTRLT